MTEDHRIEKKSAKIEKSEYQIVAFAVEELPDFHDEEKPGATGLKLALELFNVGTKDFNPADQGRYDGLQRYGHTFEVQMKWTAAQGLAAAGYPEIIAVFE